MGVFFIVFGVVTLLIIVLANFILPGRSFGVSLVMLLGLLPSISTLLIGLVIVWWKKEIRKPWIVWLLGTAGTMSGIAALALSITTLEPGVGFTHDRTTGPIRVYHRVLKYTGVSDLGVCLCTPDAQVKIALPGGFEAFAGIYDDGKPGPRPGVVVVHGNTWLGSSLSTYRMLSRHLAQEGYIVLAFDFPGFGESDDPFAKGPSSVAAAYNRTGQVDAAIDYLIENTEVDASNITVFGHSAGVDWAMRAGAQNPKVSKVAAMIAPPPPAEGTWEGDYDAKRGAYFSARTAEQYRFVYGKEQPDWYRWELIGIHERYNDDVWAHYTAPEHAPFLLILGERDEPRGHDSVLSEFDRVSEPKRLVLLDGSGHYLNTAQSLGLVFYDMSVAHQITDAMVSWIGSNSR